jgi:NADPH2:quinone reductase
VEAAGVVEAVGGDVDGLAVGDEVFGRAATGFGTYTELTVLDGTSTVKKPVQIGFDAAASIPVSAVTAWAAIEQLGLGEGDTLLLNAAGGSVGVVLLQLARDRGVAAFGIASESKRAMVESLGGILVPYDGGADVVAEMRALLPGGVDGIVDLLGGDSLQQIAVLVKNPAHILSGVDPSVESLGGAMISQDRPASMLTRVANLMAEGKLDAKITDSYRFDEAGEALASVESGHSLGKVVIDLTQTTAT